MNPVLQLLRKGLCQAVTLGGKTYNQQQFRAKIGRNDPCPCRSGKKYKKCCGR